MLTANGHILERMKTLLGGDDPKGYWVRLVEALDTVEFEVASNPTIASELQTTLQTVKVITVHSAERDACSPHSITECGEEARTLFHRSLSET